MTSDYGETMNSIYMKTVTSDYGDYGETDFWLRGDYD